MRVEATSEYATDQNLNEAAYLAANVDVRNSGMSAREHFDRHGREEQRRQLTGSSAARAVKFQRFRHVIDSPYDDDFSGTFPISCTKHPFSLDDYRFESANPGFGPFDHEVKTHPDNLYVDIGCGYRQVTFENCLYVEVYPSRSADLIVEPSCVYPIRTASVAGIGCFAVLEHTRKPWVVVSEMRRMLKPGGKVFIDWPFLQPVHGFPSHFFNATREGLRSIFEDNGFSIEICETGAHETPAYSVRWLLGMMAERLPAGPLRERFQAMTVRDLVALDVHGEAWRDLLNGLDPSAIAEFACGNMLIGTKTDG